MLLYSFEHNTRILFFFTFPSPFHVFLVTLLRPLHIIPGFHVRGYVCIILGISFLAIGAYAVCRQV